MNEAQCALEHYADLHRCEIMAGTRGMLQKRISNDIRLELMDHWLSESQAKIIQEVQQKFTGTKKSMHRNIDMKVGATTFIQVMAAKVYMAKRKENFIQMLQAAFTNIQDENTSVRISLNGATTHHHFRTVSRVLCVTGIPKTIRKL